jgi:hypothetical protein
MRDWRDFSDIELVELTSEQIQTFVDRECAERGIPIPEKPTTPAAAKPSIPAPDLPTFTIGGLSFTEASAASSVLAAINAAAAALVKLDYNYNIGAEYKHATSLGINDYQYPKVEVGAAYSPAVYATIAPAIQDFKKNNAQYESERKDYEKALEKTNGIRREISAAISEASDRIYQRQKYARLAQKYIALAEGDIPTAERFFMSAYGNDVAEAFGWSGADADETKAFVFSALEQASVNIKEDK